MDEEERYENIDATTFASLLSEYPNVVPAKLSKLDHERYDNIPNLLSQREGSKFLTKAEVATLVDWKLSHGKFRPTLKGLVQQNSDAVVKDQTEDAFKAFTGGTPANAKASLNLLTKLKGIGPATASLLLSVYDPKTAPFFSDELFRWCFFEDGKGHGWDRDIKYNLKEYMELFVKVQRLRDRLSLNGLPNATAIDIEKVAYVLGKRAAGGSVAPVAGTKRKAKAEPEHDLPKDPVAAAKDHMPLNVGSDAANELKAKQTEQIKSKKSIPKPVTAIKKAKPQSKTTDATAATTRPRRKAARTS